MIFNINTKKEGKEIGNKLIDDLHKYEWDEIEENDIDCEIENNLIYITEEIKKEIIKFLKKNEIEYESIDYLPDEVM